MSKTKIEWTDETWNPVTGCSRVSSGCDHCYAMHMARRLDGRGMGYDGTTRRTKARGTDWTGKVNLHADRLHQPLGWRKPRRVFVCSMGDLFHPSVPVDFIDQVFAIMALAKDHTFQVLTKRPERMAEYFDSTLPTAFGPFNADERLVEAMNVIVADSEIREPMFMDGEFTHPLPNVWLGTSVENQEAADERIPHLLECPAAVRFLSCEPLLGPITLRWRPWKPLRDNHHLSAYDDLDWIIVGGESGNGARPMHPDWVRQLRDQCRRADVPFFFKQWGAYTPYYEAVDLDKHEIVTREFSEGKMRRVGKKRAGRQLDGRTHDAFPEPVAA